MLLRAYQNHPCVWSEIVEELKDNIEKSPKEAQEIYRNGSIKKLRDRLGGKLRKLMAAKTADNDGDIWYVNYTVTKKLKNYFVSGK